MASHLQIETFSRFTSDAVGLERLLRGIQALVLILLAHPYLLDIFLVAIQVSPSFLSLLLLIGVAPSLGDEASVSHPLSSHKASSSDVVSAMTILRALNLHLNMLRRVLRFFRWCDCFLAAQNTLISLLSWDGALQSEATEIEKGKMKVKQILSLASKLGNGIYFFLEALTLADHLAIPGLAPLGTTATAKISTAALWSWLGALAAGVLMGLMEMGEQIMLITLERENQNEREKEGNREVQEVKDSAGRRRVAWTTSAKTQDTEHKEEEYSDLKRRGAYDRNPSKGKDAKVNFADIKREGKKRSDHDGAAAVGNGPIHVIPALVANILDLTLPAKGLGLVELGDGFLAWSLLISTIITGKEVWTRCKKEVVMLKGVSP